MAQTKPARKAGREFGSQIDHGNSLPDHRPRSRRAPHTLYYDPNGAAPGYTVIATVESGSEITAGDLQLVNAAASE